MEPVTELVMTGQWSRRVGAAVFATPERRPKEAAAGKPGTSEFQPKPPADGVDTGDRSTTGDSDSPRSNARVIVRKSRTIQSPVDLTAGGEPRDFVRNLTDLAVEPSGNGDDEGDSGTVVGDETLGDSGDPRPEDHFKRQTPRRTPESDQFRDATC